MDALGKLYTSTAIVTVNVEGKLNGITVAWVTRVSWQPPMVAVSIGKPDTQENSWTGQIPLLCAFSEKTQKK